MGSCVYERLNKVCGIRVLGTKNNLTKICLHVYLQTHFEFPNALKMASHFLSSNSNSIHVATYLSVMSPNFAFFYLCHEVVPGGAANKCDNLCQHNPLSRSRIEVGTSGILIWCDNYCTATIVNNVG